MPAGPSGVAPYSGNRVVIAAGMDIGPGLQVEPGGLGIEDRREEVALASSAEFTAADKKG